MIRVELTEADLSDLRRSAAAVEESVRVIERHRQQIDAALRPLLAGVTVREPPVHR